MKGIILAAGRGTRLYPMTCTIPKPMLPVYDKPMIYYPLSVLIQLGITEVLIIVPPDEYSQDQFEYQLGDGYHLGININYKDQPYPRGIADAFIVGEEFIGDDSVILILGDNIFFNSEIELIKPEFLSTIAKYPNEASVFGYQVNDPWRFGVVELDSEDNVVSIEEKPIEPKSNLIIPGLYYYPNDVIKFAKKVEPSARGEIEITSINQMYLAEHRLRVTRLPAYSHWYDTGTADSLLEASIAVRNYQPESYPIGCIEFEAYEAGLITNEKLRALGNKFKDTRYGAYLIDYSYANE